MDKYKKLVIVPCRTDIDTGQVVIDDDSHPPYGYHQVICVYPDDSEWLIATMYYSVDIEQVKRIVSILNIDNVPVEVASPLWQ